MRRALARARFRSAKHRAHIDAQVLRDTRSIIFVCPEEVAELSHLHFLARLFQSTCDALCESISVRIIKHAKEIAGLCEVVVIDRRVVSINNRLAQLPRRIGERGVWLWSSRDRIGPVVGSRTVVASIGERSIADVVHHGTARLVHGNLVAVDSDAVQLRIGVRHQPSLQHLVRTRGDPRYERAWLERCLLNIGEIVFWIAIEFHHADFKERKLSVRPNLCEVKWIPTECMCLCIGHDLNTHTPLWKISRGDRLEQVALMTLSVFTDQFRRFFIGEILDALLGLEMKLAPDAFTRTIDERIGVAAIPIHIAKARRNAAVTKQNRHLVQTLWTLRPEVPLHVHVAHVGLGMSLLCVDEVLKLVRIANEKHWRVVAHKVPVALLGVKLHRESAHIALRIRRAAFAGDRAEPHEEFGLLADVRKEIRARELGDVARDGEGSEGARSLRMHDAFWDAFTIEVLHLLEQRNILHEHRTARSRGERMLHPDGGAVGGGEQGRVGGVRLIVLHRASVTVTTVKSLSRLATISSRGHTMFFRQIVEPNLSQYAYLIGCQKTGEAILFDPLRDVDRYLNLAASEKLKIVAVAETHIHADFLSGAREMAARVGARVYVSADGGVDWQSKWVSGYDHVLLHDGSEIVIGGVLIRALHTPGHTPEHMSYLVFDRGSGSEVPIGLISGDFVFAGDLGRPDLLETAAGVQGIALPSARALFESARRFAQLPAYLQVWPGHGAGSACGKALGAIPQTTVGYETAVSPILQLLESESAFIKDILSGQPEPPLYFARMKVTNRDGVPVLGALPSPQSLTDIRSHAAQWESPGTVVLDMRPWNAFREGHLPGALHVPRGKMFAMVVGSYVKPAENVVLVCEPSEVDGFVRELVRIGYDKIIASLSPAALAGATKLERSAEVTVHEASAHARAGAFVLDVRGASEHEAACIEGSMNAAYTRLTTKLSQIPRDKLIIVHCALGGRSAAATAMLQRLGYDAANVAGGFEAWKKANLPTAVPMACA